MLRLLLALLLLLVTIPALTGCEPKRRSQTAGGKVVNIAVWSNYLSPDLIAGFEKQTGVKIQVSNYSSNEELLAKLQAGATGYDVAVPSDYMVSAMSKLGLLSELDAKLLPNAKALDGKLLKRSFDPTNKYSLPYNWGTTGIAVNRVLHPGKIRGWKDIFEDPALARKFSLLDDVRETIGAALKYKGFSLNSRDPKQLQAAKEVLLKVRGRLKSFTSEPMMPLLSGEVAVAHAYLSDSLQAGKRTDGKIEYVIPEEGTTFWIENLVIPKGALHPAEAHALINYLLDPSSFQIMTQQILAAPANPGAIELLPPALQKNPALFPSASVLAKCEMFEDLGDSLKLWDRIWTEVKADQ